MKRLILVLVTFVIALFLLIFGVTHLRVADSTQIGSPISPYTSGPSSTGAAPSPAATSAPRAITTPKNFTLGSMKAPVVPAVLTGNELLPPSNPKVLGWWGQPAGSLKGITLLTGHTVHTGGGTFDDLEKVKVGTVANLSGAKYVVASVEVISKKALAERSAKLFSQSGPARLVLVTCENYDAKTHKYSSNVVVVLTPQKG